MFSNICVKNLKFNCTNLLHPTLHYKHLYKLLPNNDDTISIPPEHHFCHLLHATHFTLIYLLDAVTMPLLDFAQFPRIININLFQFIPFWRSCFPSPDHQRHRHRYSSPTLCSIQRKEVEWRQ